MFKNLSSKITAAAILIILILSSIMIYYYQLYSKSEENLKVEKAISKQNKAYWEDIVKQKNDSIQTLAGLVTKLNQDNIKTKEKYVLQNNSLQLQIKELRAQGSAVHSNGEDSLGKYLQIDFKGEKLIISYEGFTKHYFSLNKDIYSIGFNFDPIKVFSEFYKDVDGIWKVRTESLTSGIFLKSDYKIDSAFYDLYQREGIASDKQPVEETHVIGLRIRAGIAGVLTNNSWYNQDIFDLSAEAYYKFIYVMYNPLLKGGAIGVYYDLDLTKPFNFIKDVLSIF
jgi:Tfp pilus assembly major pilin PilA